jgi:hypothetical protein
LDEEKSELAGLPQQNRFGTALFHNLLRLVKGTQDLPEKSVIIMI